VTGVFAGVAVMPGSITSDWDGCDDGATLCDGKVCAGFSTCWGDCNADHLRISSRSSSARSSN
jgi:hypothetical protein